MSLLFQPGNTGKGGLSGLERQKAGPEEPAPVSCRQVRSSGEERIEQALLPQRLRLYRWLRYLPSR